MELDIKASFVANHLNPNVLTPQKCVWTSTLKTKNEVNKFSFKLPIFIAESGRNSTFKQ